MPASCDATLVGMARIGTSGWVYPHWRGVLYHEADQRRWLGTYVAEFDTVELNASFYRWPPASPRGAPACLRGSR